MADNRYSAPRTRYNSSSTAPAYPAYEPEKIRKAKQDYVRRANERIEVRVQSRIKEKAGMNVLQTLAAAAAVVLLAVFAWTYLNECFRLRENRAEAERTASQYRQLLNENTLAMNRIECGTDYEAVYDYAVNTLHMTVPMKQQIVYYDSEESEYVDKSGEIPK